MAEVEQFKGQARLPKFVVPKRYDLSLKPDLAACKFTGVIKITVDVVADTRFLVLHAADLAIYGGAVWFKSGDQSKELRPSEIVAVEADNEMDEIFDTISYSKGAVVIRMLQSYLGRYFDILGVLGVVSAVGCLIAGVDTRGCWMCRGGWRRAY